MCVATWYVCVCVLVFPTGNSCLRQSTSVTIAEVIRRWGNEETATEKVKKRRLAWLGHLARMPIHRRSLNRSYSAGGKIPTPDVAQTRERETR